MSQSLSRVIVHLVFSTRGRAPVLSPDLRPDLHRYLAGVLREIDSPALQVGGVEDHVHLLFGLSRTRTIASVAEAVKTSSSAWLKRRDRRLREFHWQGGYGAFSVGMSGLSEAIRYVRRQEEHHRRCSFQEELRELLSRSHVPFDERYLWD